MGSKVATHDLNFFVEVIINSNLVAYMVYMYSLINLKVGELPNRMPHVINYSKIVNWMDILKESFNLRASTSDPYGIVYYPKLKHHLQRFRTFNGS